jgi:polysaccharide deacetylase 2 family uncharacterized protein YibQ
MAFAAAAPATALLPHGTVRFIDVPVVTLPIAAPDLVPAEPGAALARRIAMLASPEPDPGRGPPTAIDPQLVEVTALGELPRVDEAGRTPLGHYARPAARDCQRPCVAVLVTSLGLADRLTQRALTLPGEVGLSFSPYARAAVWQARARAASHEALLGLPLEPERFPVDDNGPLTIRAATPLAARSEAMLRVLAQGGGYVAVDGAAGAFAADPGAFAPLAARLHERGLGLIELGGDALGAPARLAGLAYAGGAMPVDRDPSPAAVDRALAEVAAAALAHGRAVAVAQALPASLDRIAAWIAGLPGQGLALVAPGVLLADQAGAVAGRD